MLENLKLPLCPKCGDTKNVKDKNDYSQCIIHRPNYQCTVCDISWTPYRIVDNKTNQFYKVHSELGSKTVRIELIKWWHTLTENL